MSLFSAVLEALGAITPSLEFHVADVGDDGAEGSASRPFRTIGHALSKATGGQAVTVTVSGTRFDESLTVPSNVTIRASGAGAGISSTRAGPVIRIDGASNVKLTGLRMAVGSFGGAYPDAGGVVLISNSSDVLIERCDISGGVAGRGGGIAALRSQGVLIRGCDVHDNTAGRADTTLAGAGIDIVALPPKVDWPSHPGDGGGIYLGDTSAEITDGSVHDNDAILFGGGIAIDQANRRSAAVVVSRCEIVNNQTSHGSLARLIPEGSATGSASARTRTEMTDPVLDAYRKVVLPESDENKLVALMHGVGSPSGLGGGIAVRNCESVQITQCLVGVTRSGKAAPNLARRGAGISCYGGGYPAIENCMVANNLAGGDGGGIGIDLFDPYLPPGTTEMFNVKLMPMIPRRLIRLTGNTVDANGALEDGGGIYATGAAQVAVKGGSVTRNRSVEDGGGIRATYATNLFVQGTSIRGNAANIDNAEADGGGGVSARNANVHLQDCEIVQNTVNSFAGGAVYFASCWEGGLSGRWIPSRESNVRSTFDQIMEDPAGFSFRTRVLRLVNCRGSDNRASGDSGAGGFLYAVRSPLKDKNGNDLGGGEPMWVDVEGARTCIGPNVSEHNRDGGRKQGNVVIELSGRPEDRVWISPDIPAAAIAAATPAPPATTPARAVLVLPDADATHDEHRTPWPGISFAIGPRPEVTAVSPAEIAASGGTALTIEGTGFDAGAVVQVAGTTAAVVSRTATRLVVTTAPANPGPADLSITLLWGARATLAAAVTVRRP